MIQANELRIGNWIMKEGEQFQVTPYTFLIVERDPNQFSPISLTEEWLLKIVFVYTDGEDACDCIWTFNGFEIWEHAHGFCHSYGMGGDVNNLHQLQNLYYALTNQELNITG